MRLLRIRQSWTRRHGDTERGAVATIVAILFAGLVIMGMLAVSVDLGNLTYERRQVQNGADATVMALAAECAADATTCEPGAVEDLLGANSHDALGQYSDSKYEFGACGHETSGLSLPLLDSCTIAGDIENLGKCPPVPDALPGGIPYVETYAATQSTTGDALFLPFSRALAGGDASGDKGTSACARAAWGQPVGFAGSLPLTFSACEWERQVEDGPGYVTEHPVGSSETDPGYGGAGQPDWPDSAGKEVVIMLHDPKDEDDDCSWNGKDTSGGFGWLENDGNCAATLYPDDWTHIDTGNNIPNGCGERLPQLRHRVVDIPVFDCIVGSHGPPIGDPPSSPSGICDPGNGDAGGNKSWYHLAGWAKFYISGYKLTGSDVGTSSMPGGKSCTGGERCLIGWFMSGVLADDRDIAPPGGADDFGAYVIKPIG